MVQAIKKRVRVGAGGTVAVQDPLLPEGAEAEVIVLLGASTEATATEEPMSLANIVGSGRGGFSSVDEVDQYIRDLRDEWD